MIFNWDLIILILSQFWNCATTLTLWEIDELSHAKNMAIRKNYPNSLKLFEVPDSIETKFPQYIYSGTRWWINPTISHCSLFCIFFYLDTPFSFVADTIVLPFTVPMTIHYYIKLPATWKRGRIIGEIERGNDQEVKRLVQSGIEKNSEPLYAAVKKRNLNLSKYLIEKGVKVESDFDLTIAIRNLPEPQIDNSSKVKLKLVKLLVGNGADVNSKHGFLRNDTALGMSSYENEFEITKFLIEQGANVNYGDIDFTPLHWAVFHNNFPMVEQLLQKGANINKKNSRDGNTPIYASMGWNNKSMTDYLIKNGADLNVKNDSGLTPIEYAKRR
jgi:uncharacterized protein YceK